MRRISALRIVVSELKQYLITSENEIFAVMFRNFSVTECYSGVRTTRDAYLKC